MALRILRGQIVAVVGTHQWDACLLVEAQQALVDHRLIADAVVLELQIEAILPKDVPHLQGEGLGALVVPVDQPLGDLPGQARGQGDQPLAVGAQKGHVNAGLDVEPLYKPHADQVAEIPVALIVPAKQHQMAALRIQLMDLVKPGPAGGRDIDLTADNGLDSLFFAGPVEVDGAVHDAVVRHRHGGLPQLLDPSGQAVNPAEAVQQAVLCVDMEMNK